MYRPNSRSPSHLVCTLCASHPSWNFTCLTTAFTPIPMENRSASRSTSNHSSQSTPSDYERAPCVACLQAGSTCSAAPPAGLVLRAVTLEAEEGESRPGASSSGLGDTLVPARFTLTQVRPDLPCTNNLPATLESRNLRAVKRTAKLSALHVWIGTGAKAALQRPISSPDVDDTVDTDLDPRRRSLPAVTSVNDSPSDTTGPGLLDNGQLSKEMFESFSAPVSDLESTDIEDRHLESPPSTWFADPPVSPSNLTQTTPHPGERPSTAVINYCKSSRQLEEENC